MISAQTLGAWGILRPAEVIELAAAARLDLAAACTMLQKESGGGRNVWGSDGVQTGGTYSKGAEVTRAAYAAYRAAQDAGRIGAQGVGPTQLTYPPLQRQADARGGCWDWRANVAVGFEHLAQLQRSYGVRDGFRRYNGSGAAAEAYADDSMRKLAVWQLRIGTPSSAPAGPALTLVPNGDDVMNATQEAKLDKVLAQLALMKPGQPLPGRAKSDPHDVLDDQFGWTLTAAGRAGDTLAEVRAMRATVENLARTAAAAAPGIDYTKLAAALVEQLRPAA